MTTFRFQLVKTWAGNIDKKEAFSKCFPEHFQWLEDNGIAYEVNAFVWPTLPIGAMAMTNHIEFDLIIEDTVQAVMFRLYSDIPPMDGDLDYT